MSDAALAVRRFTASHVVGAADVDAEGNAHYTSLARWLQETAFADGVDSGVGADSFWIIRRLALTVRRLPAFADEIEVETWCSAKAKTVAERSSAIRGGSADLDAVAIWIHVDPETRLPARLPTSFEAVYGPSAGDRKARSLLRHPPEPPAGAERLPWSFGRADVDFAGHVSNLWYWRVAEEYLDVRGADGQPVEVEVEFRAGIGAGPAVVHRSGPMIWVSAEDGTIAATMSLESR
jgi:acyl-ACP thioesterase